MKRRKVGRREKIELNKQGLCWKCEGKLGKVEGKKGTYICSECQGRQQEAAKQRRLEYGKTD